MIIQKETKEELIRYKGRMKGEKKKPKNKFQKGRKRKGKDDTLPSKDVEKLTEKNTGMNENIPVLIKNRAKTILIYLYITYTKALHFNFKIYCILICF